MTLSSYFFSHDFDASLDPKCLALIAKGGIAAYGFYWVILELMAREGGKLKQSDSTCIALAMLCYSKPEQCQWQIDLLLECELLLLADGFLLSPSLQKRLGKLDELKAKRSEAGKAGAKKRWKKQEVNSKRIANDSKAIAPLKQNIADKIREDKIREDKSVSTPTPKSDLSKFQNHELARFFNFQEQCPTTGNFALEKYPLIRTTPTKLQAAFDQFAKGGIPAHEYERPFAKVAARLEVWKLDPAKAGKVNSVDGMNWVTGWAYRDTLDELAKEKSLENRGGAR